MVHVGLSKAVLRRCYAFPQATCILAATDDCHDAWWVTSKPAAILLGNMQLITTVAEFWCKTGGRCYWRMFNVCLLLK